MRTDDVTWEQHPIPATTGGAWRVPAGGVVRVIDVEGSQSGDIFIVDASDVSDGLSNGRSFDYNNSIQLTAGARLFSSRSKVLATIAADDVGRHDFLYTPCSQEMYELEHGATGPHPNCYDNLTGALARFGVPASTVTVAFNVFMCTTVGPDGGLTISAPLSRAGDALTLVAERDVLVAVSACSAEAANGGGQRPMLVEIHT